MCACGGDNSDPSICTVAFAAFICKSITRDESVLVSVLFGGVFVSSATNCASFVRAGIS